MPTIQELQVALRQAWCRETAQVPGSWSPSNPAAGQCWQSAYVVRYFLGGEIIVAEVLPRSNPIQRHAWNKLPSGVEVDLTSSQFRAGQEFERCLVPEELIWSVVGAKAKLLLTMVNSKIADTPSDA